MAEPYISFFRLCPPYRNMTTPYGPPKPSKMNKYKKTNFSPELSILEIEEWINNPPKFNTEKNFILEQINLLDNLDITIAFVNFENNKIENSEIKGRLEELGNELMRVSNALN